MTTRYENLSLSELKQRCAEFGLDAKGKKAELLSRVYEFVGGKRTVFSDMNITELKQRCREFGLPVGGNKGDLVKRIEDLVATTEKTQGKKPQKEGFENLSLAELKVRCRELDLAVSGTKMDLIPRIERHLNTLGAASKPVPAKKEKKRAVVFSPSPQKKKAKKESGVAEESEVCCPEHSQPCRVFTVKKEGPNQGRAFYKCSLPPTAQCKFFAWADENNNKKPGNSNKSNVKHESKSTVTCKEHGHPCRIFKVKKEGPNQGREFYSCSLAPGNGKCKFFKWVEVESAGAHFYDL
uniref:SAP domain-containing protein n=1 Tax=Mucochytrium quahogii TaxID=96639 RepID=A0A7S2RAZ2_9STRA|mmetsp:Transcript_19980/g.32946  ORF Transcript_19980/g.32946 Transcript_19980/m.32946 type:complete len:295 (-) Transcript_19980:1146-2030(-)|eukprot:CAMPEP_0203789866 /NCGR_PEP_ID=MMETSP0100_2-20121128/3715_1 /ASSEMBLY_ACC=CAM_ASM_000210 /TAXON_ID=96639 /ORGANISM=" , Strain NY0313808BC1" /LENGTH=294 /DNA_ID=CAMNT_0050692917 /DNA_START=51 /DNA_END=935 /DNA_ORIENTATION=-